MYKIMIIDDNHISVDGICHNIDWSDLNAEVACKAYDGQQALDYLQNNMVDLIISDIEMPQLDGLSLAQNALKINSSIKIILISAFDKFEYAKQAIRLGAFDYIEKPLDYSYLKKIIRNALSMLNKEQRNLEILKQSRPIMIDNLIQIIYAFLTIFLYLLKCPQSLILSALRAFCFCGKPHISRSIFLYFRYQAWLKSW